MELSEQQIHALMTGKIFKVLSQEEELLLERLIVENEELQMKYDGLVNNYLQNDFKRMAEERKWVSPDELISHSGRRRKRVTVRRIILAAASVAVIVIAVYLFIDEKKPEPTLVNKEKSIELKLANGMNINIAKDNDTIHAGAALLTQNNNTLRYSTGVADLSASSSLNQLTIPRGMSYRVVLSDGTEVWLNAGTTLRFPFNFRGKTREIGLDGEAYLKVSKDVNKPFIVRLAGAGTHPATIRVLGTEFNVNTYDTTTLKVSLVEGSISLQVPNDSIVIKPGIEAIYSGKREISTRPFDDEETLSWRQGRYYFYEATLEDIARQLPLRTGTDVVIDNQTIKTRIYTGVLNVNKPLSSFLTGLKRTMKIDYYFAPDGVLHFK